MRTKEIDIWRSRAIETLDTEDVSVEAAMLELAITDHSCWSSLEGKHEALKEIGHGLGIGEGDTYGLHLLNMLRQFRKVEVEPTIRDRIRALGESDLRVARERYVQRARKRMLADDSE